MNKPLGPQLPMVDISCEIQKAVRGRWASQREVIESTGLSPKTVRTWLEGFERNGFIKTRPGERREGFTNGRVPIDYTLSSQWGGL